MNTKTTALIIITIFTTADVLLADGTNAPFKSEQEKASYAIGLNFGSNWKKQDIEVDYNAFLRGLKDAGSDKRLLTDEEIRETIMKFQQELAAKQQEKRRQLSEKNKKEGAAYLAENKNKPGVVTTSSGLQYKVLTEGNGESPKPDDTVTANYRGTLLDGTEFDSSPKDKPGTFRVNGVIRGWTEALTMMKPGAKWQLAIPSDLAYGDFGRPPHIGPGATLLFDIELVSVQSAPPRAPLTSDIIKVPSLEEMKKGAKIETIKAEDLEKLQKQEQEKKSSSEQKK